MQCAKLGVNGANPAILNDAKQVDYRSPSLNCGRVLSALPSPNLEIIARWH